MSGANKQKIPGSIVGGDTSPVGLSSGGASGVKICQIKHVELPPCGGPRERWK